MLQQRTVKQPVKGEGVGLHTGEAVAFTIRPAPADSGIVFVRADVQPEIEIPARVENVVSTSLATTLGHKEWKVGTVEHLLAALYGLGVDNAQVEVVGPEVPIFDGSAAPFVSLIREAGTIAQRRPKRYIAVRRPVSVTDATGQRMARLEPARRFELRCAIDFDHPLVSEQVMELSLSDETFVSDVASARTFGFARDVDAMREAGLARGGSLENAVVVDDFSIRNPEGLRFPNEFVRHKILDAVGDLALLGARLIGRYVGVRGGHSLNTRLAAALLADPRNYEILEFNRRREADAFAVDLPSVRLGNFAPA